MVCRRISICKTLGFDQNWWGFQQADILCYPMQCYAMLCLLSRIYGEIYAFGFLFLQNVYVPMNKKEGLDGFSYVDFLYKYDLRFPTRIYWNSGFSCMDLFHLNVRCLLFGYVLYWETGSSSPATMWIWRR
jgi:hypothetical protein